MPRRWTSRSAARTAALIALSLPLEAGTPYLALVSEPESPLPKMPPSASRGSPSASRKPAILRLAVDGGGCAGFTYKFELADERRGDDTIAETDGVKLVVDPVSLDLVKGSAVDFVEDLGGAAFKVHNPNAQSGCGCGSSFSV